MQIRKLTAGEMAAMEKAQSIAFVFPIDTAKAAESSENPGEREHEYAWGAFDEGGQLLSGMINWRLSIYFDGHVVGMGGIGGVISLPEGRMRGNIRRILRAVFDDIRQGGGVFSMLYPFSQSYYRQFGYEVCYAAHKYAFPTEQLRPFQQTGTARMHLPGEPDTAFRPIYDAYARRYNCAVARDTLAWQRVLKGDPYKCESYRYILSQDGRDTAYCTFRPIRLGEFHDLLLTDFAYTDADALHNLLGFLHRLSAQYQNIRIEAPSDLQLSALIAEPNALRAMSMQHIMARVVNVQKALTLMRHPEGTGAYRIAIADDFLPENSGVYSVCHGPDGVDVRKEPLGGPCDLSCSVQAFTQLCLGFCALPVALLKPDVKLFGNRSTLEKVFIEKPRFHSDRY